MKLVEGLYRFAAVALLVAWGFNAAAQPSQALSQKSSAAAQLIDMVRDQGSIRIIVQFESPVSAEITRAPASISALRAGIAAIQDAIIADHFGSSAAPTARLGFSRDITRFELTPGFGVTVNEAELESLSADPRVKYIHFNEMRLPTLDQSVPLIGMNNAYNLGALGTGQVVVVLDTGVQSNHEFLAGKVVAEACFSNNGVAGGGTLCPNGSGAQTGTGAANPKIANCIMGSSNICYHGTHVAGIAAGQNSSRQSGEPANGVAKGASIWAIQVFTRGGSGVGAFDSDIIRGLDYIFANMNNLPGGLKVASTNMSLGGGLFSTTCDTSPVKPAIDRLRNAGVLSVIASGNDGSTSEVGEPGCVSTAVTVGSTDKANVISSFSNMSNVVDLMAPGGFGGGSCAFGANNNDILAPVVVASGATNFYGCLPGTSMAAPHVAGAIAAVRSACPSASAAAIETALKNTGLPINDTRSGGTQRKPRIRVDLALHQLCGTFTIATSADPTAGGTTSGGGTYPAGSTRTVTATPNSGFHFVNWTEGGAQVSSSSSYSFTLTGNRSLVAHFVQITYTIATSADPAGGGTTSGGGTFAAGSTRTVTATPNSGYTFVNWTEGGAQVSSSASYSFTLTGNRSLVAHFEVSPTFTIGLGVDPEGAGSVSGDGTFPENSSQTVTATPNVGWKFVNWTEGGSEVSTSASYSFTLNSNRSLVAHFAPSPTFTLSLRVEPDEGGTVSGAGDFPENSSRTVTATPNGGYRFVNWTEGSSVVSTSASFTFTLNANRTLVAHFKRIFTISVSASPTSLGTVSGGGTFDSGASRTVRATPRSGSVFINWTEAGAQVSNRASYTFTLSGNRALVAHFKPKHVAANDLVGDFGASGLWEYLNNSTWKKIHANSPVLLTTGDLDGDGKDEVVATFANGFWTRYASNGRWFRLSVGIPAHIAVGDLDNSGKDDVIADYGNGVFVRMNNSGNFVRLTSLATTLLRAFDLNGNGKDEIVGVFSTGTSARYDNAGDFRSLTTDKLVQIVQGDLNGDGRPDLIGTATGVGVEALIANTEPWVKLSSNFAARLAAGDLNGNGRDEVIAVFTNGVGTFARYDNAGAFRSLNTRSIVHPVTGDLDRSGRDDLIGDFAGLGIYAFKNNTAPWVRLNATTSQRLATGGFD